MNIRKPAGVGLGRRSISHSATTCRDRRDKSFRGSTRYCAQEDNSPKRRKSTVGRLSLRGRGRKYPLMLALHLGGLARTLMLQGRHAEAEEPLREALGLRERPNADTKGWLTQSSRCRLGIHLTNLGRFSEAESFLISAFEGLTELDRTYPRTRTIGSGFLTQSKTVHCARARRWLCGDSSRSMEVTL